MLQVTALLPENALKYHCGWHFKAFRGLSTLCNLLGIINEASCTPWPKGAVHTIRGIKGAVLVHLYLEVVTSEHSVTFSVFQTLITCAHGGKTVMYRNPV